MAKRSPRRRRGSWLKRQLTMTLVAALSMILGAATVYCWRCVLCVEN